MQCSGYTLYRSLIVLVMFIAVIVANDIIGRALKRLDVPIENRSRSFDTEADMVANLSAVITALPDNNQFHGPIIAGKYLSLL